jgi:hypothetical protein
MSRFGELLGGKKAAPAPAPEPPKVEVVEVPEPVELVVEVPTPAEDVVVVDLDTMSKRQLEAYGREHGIELDRRHSRTKLVEELKEHLSNS